MLLQLAILIGSALGIALGYLADLLLGGWSIPVLIALFGYLIYLRRRDS